MADCSSSSEVMNHIQAECGCCFFEFQIENMVQCEEGHRFCFGCLRRQVEGIIYGSFKAPACLPCMHTAYHCQKSIGLSDIRRALPGDVVERYEECQAREAVIEAKLENLFYCPFCSIPCEVDKCVQVFDCPNPKCLMVSCIQCKEPSHLPLPCEENAKTSETAARRKVEERMTKAVVRECKTCNSEILKIDGCNRVTCTRCRTTMCYVCRQAISSNYEHFCDHHDHREPGKPCKICKVQKCSLWQTEVDDNVALEAREEALKELGDKEFGDQKIGPPLQKQTVQSSNPPLALGAIEFVYRDIHVNVYWDDHHNVYGHVQGNEALEEQHIQQLLQVVARQFANMANIPPPLVPPQIVRADVDELANIQLQANEGHARGELEEQQLLHLAAHQFAIMANRAQEPDRAVLEEEQHIPLPLAPQIVRADGDDADDDHVANMDVQGNEGHRAELEEQPLRHLVAHQFANMANIPPPVAPPQIVRADADELANMQLPANENDLREEQRAEDKENDRAILEEEQHIPHQ